MDRRRRVARRPRHRARAPVGRVTRRLFERLTDHLGHSVVIDAPWTTGARFVIEPLQTLFRKPVAPLPGGVTVDAERIRDLHIGQPLGRQQHDVRSIRQAPPDPAPPRQAFQLATISLSQLDLHRTPHHRSPESPTLPNCTNFTNGTLGRCRFAAEPILSVLGRHHHGAGVRIVTSVWIRHGPVPRRTRWENE